MRRVCGAVMRALGGSSSSSCGELFQFAATPPLPAAVGAHALPCFLLLPSCCSYFALVLPLEPLSPFLVYLPACSPLFPSGCAPPSAPSPLASNDLSIVKCERTCDTSSAR